MLVKSRKTLMFGWINTSCQAMSAGHAIAEKVGGIVDNGATVCHGPSLIAIEDVGITTCTLGEVKNRADCIIFWGCNPAHVHPRHMSRYSIFPRGFFTKEGAKGRKIFCIDCRYTDTARCSDIFIRIEQGCDYEFLDAIRTVLHGGSLTQKSIAGVPADQIGKLAEDLKRAKFGVIFLGMGLSQTVGRNHNIDMAINLTYDLNRFTKFVVMPMRVQGNVTGSGEVLGWQYGFPFAVDLSRGDQARHQTGETTAIDLLLRGEVEASLFVACRSRGNVSHRGYHQRLETPDRHDRSAHQLHDRDLRSPYPGCGGRGRDRRLRLPDGHDSLRDAQSRGSSRGRPH